MLKLILLTLLVLVISGCNGDYIAYKLTEDDRDKIKELENRDLVVYYEDSDTPYIEYLGTFQLYGVDSPNRENSNELLDKINMCTPGDYSTIPSMGEDSYKFMIKEFPENIKYTLETIKLEDSFKKYAILKKDDLDANSYLIENGYAVPSSIDFYQKEVSFAKENKLGLWGTNFKVMSCLEEKNKKGV